MCAECDRMEAERNTGKLRDVAARAFSDYLTSYFGADTQGVRTMAWEKFALVGNALVKVADPDVPVTLKVNRDVS